jgi:hypothetical protein
MNDLEPFAGRFSAEVDRLLEQNERAEEPGPPYEYAEMLALAERLTKLDFSERSPLQPRLRRRLLRRLEAERPGGRQHISPRRRLFPQYSERALGALAISVMLVVLVAGMPTGRAVAEAIGQFIREMQWSNTTLQQILPGQEPTPTTDARESFGAELAAGRAWEFTFEGRSFRGCCDAAVRNEVVPLPQAIAEAGFGLQLPAYLPDGYGLSEVRLLDVAPYLVFSTYEGPDGRLGLGQSLVGVTLEEHPDAITAIIESRAISVVTDGTVEEVMVASASAALIDGESLVWEDNGVSFRLIGPGLGRQMLITIAESLVHVR